MELGFNTNYLTNYYSEIKNNKFTYVRVTIAGFTDAVEIAAAKLNVLLAISYDLKVIWGVCSGSETLTAANWNDYRLAVLDAAQWSQDNGVYEFQIGNEEEGHNDDTTLTDDQLILNLIALATDVKAIFTRGKISYSFGGSYVSKWKAAGRGDIDILALNIYRGGVSPFDDGWKTYTKSLVDYFGIEHTEITEFSLSWNALDNYSTNEYTQASALSEMIEYYKTLGIQKLIFYYYGPSDNFGVRKTIGIYRQIWDVLLRANGFYIQKAGQAAIRGLSHG